MYKRTGGKSGQSAFSLFIWYTVANSYTKKGCSIMKGFVHEGSSWGLKDMPVPAAAPGEAVVQLKYAGLNRRDLYIPARRGNQGDALILGSDGAGIIESIGQNDAGLKAGDEVIINPALRWKKNSPAPPEEFDILGMPDHGTFAEKIVISADQLEKKPEFLSWEEAAVVALAGVTGYRALFTKGGIQAGMTVFIPGAGSGVATFMIQFAKAAGARVIVTSRSEAKRERALGIGADKAIDTESDWSTELKNEVIDLVIDSVGGTVFNRSLEILKKGGRMVIFGATTEDTVDFNLRSFFYGQYELLGSTMGSKQELTDMLAFMKQHKIRPVLDRTYSLQESESALNRLQESGQFGKIALKITE